MQVIYEIIVSPRKAFERLAEKPRWWQGLLIVIPLIIIGNLIGVWGGYEFIMQMSQERLSQMTPEQAEAAARWMTLPMMLGTTAINKLIIVPIVVLIQATIFHLMVPLSGGEANYGKAFGIVIWSKMAIAVGAWVGGLLTLAMGQPFRTDMGLLVDIGSKLQGGLSQIELFSIWSLVLVAEGMVRVMGCRRGMSYAVVFGLWAVWVAISFGMGAFVGKMG
ncbi:MAG: YIP1 family protein [candidate division WOR-3 bacterium]